MKKSKIKKFDWKKLQSSKKNEAKLKLEEIIVEYNSEVNRVEIEGIDNYNLKLGTSLNLIKELELLTRKFSNLPEDFYSMLNKYKSAKNKFVELNKKIEKEFESQELEKFRRRKKFISKVFKRENVIGTTGLAGGAGVATLGSTAATAIATTFGSASTGTAIASLSGAAAQSAALAWLGGGSLAAGGGGMAAGQALLALMSPLGWGVGAAAIASTGIYKYFSTKGLVAKKKHYQELINKLPLVRTTLKKDSELIALNSNKANEILNHLRNTSFTDYSDLNNSSKELIESLKNNITQLILNLES